MQYGAKAGLDVKASLCQTRKKINTVGNQQNNQQHYHSAELPLLLIVVVS